MLLFHPSCFLWSDFFCVTQMSADIVERIKLSIASKISITTLSSLCLFVVLSYNFHFFLSVCMQISQLYFLCVCKFHNFIFSMSVCHATLISFCRFVGSSVWQTTFFSFCLFVCKSQNFIFFPSVCL